MKPFNADDPQKHPASAAAQMEGVLVERALRWAPLLRSWPQRVLDRLADIAHLHRYDRRTQLMSRGRDQRDVVLIVAGCLEISSINASGTKYLLALQGPGEVLPLVHLLPGMGTRYELYALRETVLLHFPSADFARLLDGHPLLWRDIAMLALLRQRESVALLHARALQSVRRTLAATLVRLASWMGVPAQEQGSVCLRLPQNDLAAMFGITRQTMNKELWALASDGLVEIEYGQLTICDLPRLKALALAGD